MSKRFNGFVSHLSKNAGSATSFLSLARQLRKSHLWTTLIRHENNNSSVAKAVRLLESYSSSAMQTKKWSKPSVIPRINKLHPMSLEANVGSTRHLKLPTLCTPLQKEHGGKLMEAIKMPDNRLNLRPASPLKSYVDERIYLCMSGIDCVDERSLASTAFHAERYYRATLRDYEEKNPIFLVWVPPLPAMEMYRVLMRLLKNPKHVDSAFKEISFDMFEILSGCQTPYWGLFGYSAGCRYWALVCNGIWESHLNMFEKSPKFLESSVALSNVIQRLHLTAIAYPYPFMDGNRNSFPSTAYYSVDDRGTLPPNVIIPRRQAVPDGEVHMFRDSEKTVAYFLGKGVVPEGGNGHGLGQNISGAIEVERDERERVTKVFDFGAFSGFSSDDENPQPTVQSPRR